MNNTEPRDQSIAVAVAALPRFGIFHAASDWNPSGYLLLYQSHSPVYAPSKEYPRDGDGQSAGALY